MTDEEQGFVDQLCALIEKRQTCQHRWEESTFGKTHWAPHTWQWTCSRCGDMRMLQWDAKGQA